MYNNTTAVAKRPHRITIIGKELRTYSCPIIILVEHLWHTVVETYHIHVVWMSAIGFLFVYNQYTFKTIL